MLTKPQTFDELLALWATPKALSEEAGLPYVSAQMMKHRKSIGSAHWQSLIDCLAGKGIELTLEDFARMQIRRQSERRQRVAA